MSGCRMFIMRKPSPILGWNFGSPSYEEEENRSLMRRGVVGSRNDLRAECGSSRRYGNYESPYATQRRLETLRRTFKRNVEVVEKF